MEYACDVVRITANVEPDTDPSFTFTWFVNDGSGSGNVSHVFLPKCTVFFDGNFCEFVLKRFLATLRGARFQNLFTATASW